MERKFKGKAYDWFMTIFLIVRFKSLFLIYSKLHSYRKIWSCIGRFIWFTKKRSSFDFNHKIHDLVRYNFSNSTIACNILGIIINVIIKIFNTIFYQSTTSNNFLFEDEPANIFRFEIQSDPQTSIPSNSLVSNPYQIDRIAGKSNLERQLRCYLSKAS